MTEKKVRVPIPDELTTELLFINDMTCCVCREKRLPVQTHHIDDDPSNNDASNIAVLCLICHDSTLQKGGFGRKLNPMVIRKFKADWETQVGRVAGAKCDQQTAQEITADRFQIRARWVEGFIVGGGVESLGREISVDITNVARIPKHIEVLGIRIVPQEGEHRYLQLHLIKGLAHIKERFEPGEKQSFAVALTDLTSSPFHEGFKQGESLSVFVRDTLGTSFYSESLAFKENRFIQ